MAQILNVVISSTRPGRVGPTIARWFHETAVADGHFDVRLVDLAEFNLPVFDEPHHPRMQKYQHEHTKKWAASVASADAFVFVTPEYNFGPTPALVNAINYLAVEWNYKPVGFVSYGGLSGGLRGVQAIKPLMTTVKAMPIPEAVAIPMFSQQVADGRFTGHEMQMQGARDMLAELLKWSTALKTIRG